MEHATRACFFWDSLRPCATDCVNLVFDHILQKPIMRLNLLEMVLIVLKNDQGYSVFGILVIFYHTC